ncbi:MAG: hypothetical protein GX610_21840 [Rhodococcus sp.]|nr:hypothetical protein [Rhodococcus sp. (in: high G+C Gram-positive bacteria)]
MASSRKSWAGRALSLSTLGLLLVGCTSAPGAAPGPPEEEAPDFSIEDVDFAAVEWSLSHHGRMIPTDGLSFASGPAIIETVEYTIGVDAIVYGDADGDGDLDAIVPVSALDVVGGGVELGTAWYLWADQDGVAVQVRVPAALGNCDIVVESVTAVDGGFEIHEFHLRSGEESYTECGDPGSDKRTRTVTISADGPDGELWPVQTAPFAAFGGACPISVAFHGDPATADHFPAPNAESAALAGDRINTWPVEEWQIFRDGYSGWQLVGVNVDGHSGCAWTRL